MHDLKVHQSASHIDQMLRQTRMHQMQLSSMGDLKASMLLTTAAVIIPLSLQYLDDPRLRAPALVMVAFAVLTVGLAACAAMPKLGRKAPPPDAPQFNPLFFGHFSTLAYPEYLEHMEQVLASHERTYEVQIREVWQMGVYLERKKVRFIRLAYLSFLLGVALSCILWGVLGLVG